jgi:hypothetical protein
VIIQLWYSERRIDFSEIRNHSIWDVSSWRGNVTLTKVIFGSALVEVLLAVAAIAAWNQLRLLRGLGCEAAMPAEEEDHLRARAWRRLATCVLMVILGVLLAVALLWLEEPAELLARGGQSEVEKQPEFADFYGWYWIVFLLLLLALLVLAGIDMVSVRRHGWKQMRRLQEDRREMIARQAALLRQERGRES